MASFKAIEAESLKDLVKNSDNVHPNVEKNRFHQYKLNDKAAKGKLVKGAKRSPFDVIHKSLSSNLDFSLGAWNYVVLPAIGYWDQVKDEKTCKVENTIIKIGSVELGKEAMDMKSSSRFSCCLISKLKYQKISRILKSTTRRL